MRPMSNTSLGFDAVNSNTPEHRCNVHMSQATPAVVFYGSAL